jgi:hypothetical protein
VVSAGFADSGEIAFDIGHEYGNTDAAQALSE